MNGFPDDVRDAAFEAVTGKPIAPPHGDVAAWMQARAAECSMGGAGEQTYLRAAAWLAVEAK